MAILNDYMYLLTELIDRLLWPTNSDCVAKCFGWKQLDFMEQIGDGADGSLKH